MTATMSVRADAALERIRTVRSAPADGVLAVYDPEVRQFSKRWTENQSD